MLDTVAISRRLALLGLLSIAFVASPASAGARVEVWKSPLCGCCGGWVRHMTSQGFDVTVHDVDDVEPIKTANGIGSQLASCHTSVVDGYVVEGHVPASDIRRLLAERPAIKGLAVPGMPSGAPGMGPVGPSYEVLGFDADGHTQVFARH